METWEAVLQARIMWRGSTSGLHCLRIWARVGQMVLSVLVEVGVKWCGDEYRGGEGGCELEERSRNYVGNRELHCEDFGTS